MARPRPLVPPVTSTFIPEASMPAMLALARPAPGWPGDLAGPATWLARLAPATWLARCRGRPWTAREALEAATRRPPGGYVLFVYLCELNEHPSRSSPVIVGSLLLTGAQ
jgi:hypothetical protein